MTRINIATDVPSQIDTLEKLHAWSALALANMNPTLVALEGQGYTERVAQAGIFYVQSDNKYRMLCRASIEVSPDYLSGGLKTWMYVQEYSNTPLPASFKSN